MKGRLLIAATAAVAAAMALSTTAGANPAAAGGSEVRSPARVDLSTAASVNAFLRSVGVDPKGVVVQRGQRNYAGPKCPGAAWRCTKAMRVLQISSRRTDGDDDDDEGRANRFECSRSTPDAPNPTGATTLAPDVCVVVQVNDGGTNRGNCILRSQSRTPVTQECFVHQTNVSGRNIARIDQRIIQMRAAMQQARQDSQLRQMNETGANLADVRQRIDQRSHEPGPVVSQNQDADQFADNDQEATSGRQDLDLEQSQKQTARAGVGDGDDDDDDDRNVYGVADDDDDDGQPVSGSQVQNADGEADVDQDSTGVSVANVNESMTQRAHAPKGSTLIQEQIGPWRCCTFQQSNPNNVFTVRQSKVQFASTLAEAGTSGFHSVLEYEEASFQSASNSGRLFTSGRGLIAQSITQQGETQTNSCEVTNGTCIATQSCSGGECGEFTCSTDDSEECSIGDFRRGLQTAARPR